MNLSSIQNQTLKAILLPLTLLTLLLCTALICLHLNHTDKFLQQHGNAQIKHWKALVEHMGTNNPQQLEQLFASTREEPSVRALALHTKDNIEQLHLGPKFETALPTESTTVTGTFTTIESSGAILLQAKLNSGQKLYLEINKTPYLLLNFKALFNALSLWLLCCVIATILTLRYSRRIVESLNYIRSNINTIAEGNIELENTCEKQPISEFCEIVQSIEKMRITLLQVQHDNQAHINQSTEDLQETLDTIEVQNIELNIARKKALEASRVKSEFLANTSHEFRTPLNGIIGFTQLTLRTDLSEQQQIYQRTILESSQNLLSSINDILDFSKLETGQLTLDYMPLDPTHCIEETLKILAPSAQEKKLELITLLDPELPQNLLGDPLRFKQILSNLIGNGIKFSECGNIIIRAQHLQTLDTQVEIKFSITDFGIGLSREEQQELFRPFSQADSSNAREYEGAGIGLSISKGLVERMSGDIGVDSEKGQGATFWFTLKLGIDRNNNDITVTPALSSDCALIFSRNNVASEQLQAQFNSWQLNSHTESDIEQLLPSISAANLSDQPYTTLVIDSHYDLSGEDYQQLKKVIWQANQRYQCRVVIIASSEQYLLMVDATLQKLTRCCLKPLAISNLQENICEQHQDSIQPVELSPETDNSPQKATIESTSSEPPHILVVDDNPANLQLASELLKAIGAKISRASNGSEALEQCKKHDFDLIFMDVQMPILDGIETTKELRKRETEHQRTPVIALTAHAMSDQKTQLLLAGMDDYLHKPVSESQLRHSINRWSSKKPIANNSGPTPLPVIADITQANNNLVVDRSQCLELANNNAVLARDMLTMLIQLAEKERAELADLIQTENFDSLSERIHKLYGSCCYSGVPVLKDICGKLDKQLQKKDHTHLSKDMNELNASIDALLEWNDEFDIDALFGVEEKTDH